MATMPTVPGVPPMSLRALRFALFLSVLLLAACHRAPESETVATTEPASGGAFAVRAVTGESAGSQPALSIRFSEPLAQAQDFSQFLSVSNAEGASVDGAWVLGEDASLLRFPHVEAQQKFTVKIAPGIVSADGDTLSEGLSETVESVDLPPAVGFASQGSVLPSTGTDGLPIRSVNLDEVDVEFYRVRDDAFLRFLNRFQGSAQRNYWELGSIRQIAEPVYLNRFAINAAPNERKVSHLPVHQIEELSRPGLYFALMRRTGELDGNYETTYFVRTDLGVHLRAYRDRVLVATRSLASGEALGGVDLSIVDQDGSPLLNATADGEGLATLEWKFDSSKLLIARRGDNLALLPLNQAALDLSEFPITGSTADAVTVFQWSGRDLYRPGETIGVSALLRDFDGKPLKGEQPLYATLRQPDGRAYATAQLKPAALGYYRYERKLPEDLPTGRWGLELATAPDGKAPAHRFALRVEEFLPERLKLVLDSSAERLSPGQALPLAIEGSYLYGAAAAGNRFTATLSYAVDSAPLEALPGYVFGDPTQAPSKEPVDALDLSLDAEGRLSTEVPLEPGEVKGPVAVSLIGSLYESGGRPVSRVLKRSIWPADVLVGIRPQFANGEIDANADASFEILRVDANGTPQPSALKLRLIREERNYTWTYSEGLGWKVDYTSRFFTAEERDLSLAGDAPGRASFQVEWGNYRLDVEDPATGLVARYPFVAGWSWDDQNRGLDARPDKVKLALDASGYRAGDTLELTVTPPHAGEGLLLVESDRLLQQQSFEAKAGTKLRLEVDESWERHDVYITALVFRPGTAKDLTTPSRAVGIVHVPIDRKERQIEVAISAPDSMRPQTKLPVTISAPALQGQKAYVAVSAVDLGIINITAFPIPDALASFFGQRRYAIDAYDIYGRVIEALQGERARLRFGGDAALPGLAQARRPTAKVLTVDLYRGPLELDAAGKAELSFDVPDFNGALRVSALVYTADRYGSASTETRVRAPLVAEVSTPRVMAPGDRAQLSLDLQNLSGQNQRIKLAFRADSPIAIGEAEREIELADAARSSLRFPLTALNDQGVGRFELQLSGQGIELKRQFEITVRSPYPAVRERAVTRRQGADSLALGAAPDGWLPASVRRRVSASTRAPLSVNAWVNDLYQYPYGCIEQTTSKAWPYVWLDPAQSEALGLAQVDAATRAANLAFAVDRVASMQLDNGHFAYWPGDGYSDPLLTPYVVEFLQEAREAGAPVSASVLDKALNRIKEDLLAGGEVAWDRVWGEPASHVRLSFNAHAGMVLARINQAPLGSLRNLYDQQRDDARGPLALMRLAVALKLSGDTTRAEAAAALALGDKWERAEGFWGDYYTSLGDRAMSLALAIEHQLLGATQQDKIMEVAEAASAARWISTHDQLALVRLARAAAKGSSGSLQGALVVGGIEEDFSTGGWFSRDLVIEDLRAGASLRVDNSTPYYLVIDSVGVPLRAPAAESSGLRIERRWFRHNGEAYAGDTLAEGEGLVVHLRLQSEERLLDTLVIDALPGGLEIENLNLIDAKQLAEMVIDGTNLDDWRSYGTQVRHQEYREDRYVAALSLEAGSTVDLYYLVRAVSPGEYEVPPPFAEDMYRPQYRAVGARNVERLRVVAPGAR